MSDSIVFVNREFENGLWWWVFMDLLREDFGLRTEDVGMIMV
jgi:hypothetical protein